MLTSAYLYTFDFDGKAVKVPVDDVQETVMVTVDGGVGYEFKRRIDAHHAMEEYRSLVPLVQMLLNCALARISRDVAPQPGVLAEAIVDHLLTSPDARTVLYDKLDNLRITFAQGQRVEKADDPGS